MWKHLKKGDKIYLIATSGKLSQEKLENAKKYIENLGFTPKVSPQIFGDHPLYAHSKEIRFKNLLEALNDKESKAIWCLRGGAGATHLIPLLHQEEKPETEKLFIGFSDITCLHIFFSQNWGWTPIHGPCLSQVAEKDVAKESVDLLNNLIMGQSKDFSLEDLRPLNEAARLKGKIEASLVGGNLSLVQCSLGTIWQLETKNKLLFLEDIGEAVYRTLERLEHLKQNGLFEECLGLVLCDFSFKEEDPSEEEIYTKEFDRWASTMNIPVLRTKKIGHGKDNIPVSVGGGVCLALGDRASLKISWS